MASHITSKKHSSRNLRKFDETCTAVLVDTQYDPEDNVVLALGDERVDLSIECLTPSGMVYQVPFADKAFIMKNFVDGDFVSGETDMVFEESIQMDISKSELVLNSIPTLIQQEYPVKGESGKGRKLAVTGNRSVFAVRIVLSDGQTTASEDAIRDGIFGTNNDRVNLQTQYSRCSHGQLNFDSVGTVPGDNITINNGVITVNLPSMEKSYGNTNIRNAINSLILTEFGQQPYQIADHVMYCMPQGVMKGIAFAGVNSWFSVYNNEWCHQYSAVQMHEIGHNIGLAHSGDGDISVGTNEYKDQSGNMGFSYREDDTYMCFNSAKSWQLGWYSTSAITIDAGGLRVYEGDVAGVVENPFTVNVPQVVKLNTPIGDDFFLNFNRRSAFNSGTKEGANQVMITKAGNEGNYNSKSVLLAKLSAGGSWTSDSVFNGEDVTVKVNSIGSRANIKICVGTCPTVTDIPSSFPSASPVASTGVPSSSPSTSPSASPSTSPSVSPVAPTGAPSYSPSMSPSASPVATTDVPSNAPASASPCIERTKSKFVLIKTTSGQPIIETCKYLQKLKKQGKNITKICAANHHSTTGKYKPAKDVCQVTCETCPSTCVEVGSAKAYFKTVDDTDTTNPNPNHKITKCGRLAEKSAEIQADACAIDVSPITWDAAKAVCPVTCQQC